MLHWQIETLEYQHLQKRGSCPTNLENPVFSTVVAVERGRKVVKIVLHKLHVCYTLCIDFRTL